jgi:2-oxoisovalerate dehydrogenase E1 component
MTTFRDQAELYGVLDALFARLSQQTELAASLLAGKLVLRFTYKEPAGSVTVDLREPPLTWTFGDSELKPDVELIQSADIAHRFWLGRLGVPGAIARRQVVARGSVGKALSLLPALQPAFPQYELVLRELGRVDLLPTDEIQASWLQRTRSALGRWGRNLPWSRARFSMDEVALPPLPIPLTDSGASPALTFTEQHLPAEGAELDLAMLERMLLIRAFELELSRANALGELPTEAIHLSIGQEATAVGVCFALQADDYIATTHRGHGHMLAKGADVDGMMAEMHGKAEGLCGGHGGSMHVTDGRIGAIGANGIVGASPLMAAGAAHSAKLRGSGQVAVAFLGDGATNQGMFHEALNFAAVFDLPAVFVIENNLYGEFTPIEKHTRVVHLAERAKAYGMPGVSVDGNDVGAVYAATKEAVKRARDGGGPTLLECRTYRWHGHMEGEQIPYRTAEEIESWKARCPIEALAAGLDPERVQGLRTETSDRVQRARLAAEQGTEPEMSAAPVFAPDDRALWTPATPPVGPTRQITCSQALWEALHEELERDERVYMLGEDVTTGGYFAVTEGLVDDIGHDRVVDTPISEYAIVGTAVGAALSGMRPVAEILFSDFLTTCMDPLVNQAAKLRLMSGGQYTMPLVVRTPGGAGLGMAAQHSQSLEALLTGIPGLIVVAPATPADAKGLLKAAIRSDNPVLFFENKLLYAATGPVPEGEYVVPLGVADIKRSGRDVTVVTVGAALSKALEAAEVLTREGVDVEVVDIRTLVPLDVATILGSVARTGRLVTVEDAPRTHGFGAEVVAEVARLGFGALRAAPRRVAARDVPLSYNSALENAALPAVDDVVQACRGVLGLS